jgi:hypothetical protein
MHLQKTEKLKNGNQLFVFFSNDKGRGKNNCTIQLVGPGEKRKLVAKMTKNILSEVYTTSWKGDINFSKDVQKQLGIAVDDLKSYAQIKRSDAKIKAHSVKAMVESFEKLKADIKKNNPGIAGLITKDELISYAEKVYFKGWLDHETFDKEVKIWDFSKS